MIRYNVKVNDQIYQVDLERDTTIHDVQHTSKNNAVLEKGYTAFNRCVNAFCVSIVALIALAIISIFLGL